MRRSEERIAVVLRSLEQAGGTKSVEKNRDTLEVAFGLAQHKKVHITAVGVYQSTHSESMFQEALDLGCDASVAIEVPVPCDFFGEALLLRAAIAAERTTLVLCPDFNEDFKGASLGAALAFMLNLTCITGVSDCTFKGDDYLVSRRSEFGQEKFRCPRPALFALVDRTPGAARENITTTRGQEVRRMSAAELLEDLSALYSRSTLAMHMAPRPSVDAPELLSDPAELLSLLQAANLWNAG